MLRFPFFSGFCDPWLSLGVKSKCLGYAVKQCRIVVEPLHLGVVLLDNLVWSYRVNILKLVSYNFCLCVDETKILLAETICYQIFETDLWSLGWAASGDLLS